MILNPNEIGAINNRVEPISSEKLVLWSSKVNNIPNANKRRLQHTGKRSLFNNGKFLKYGDF